MPISTALMDLVVPLDQDPSTSYLPGLQDAFEKIDAHNHAPGKGARVPVGGLLIDAALSFGGNSATDLRSVQLTNQAAQLTATADNGALYIYNGELYFLNTNNQSVKISNGPALANASGGGGGFYGDYQVYNARASYDRTQKLYSFLDHLGASAAIQIATLTATAGLNAPGLSNLASLTAGSISVTSGLTAASVSSSGPITATSSTQTTQIVATNPTGSVNIQALSNAASKASLRVKNTLGDWLIGVDETGRMTIRNLSSDTPRLTFGNDGVPATGVMFFYSPVVLLQEASALIEVNYGYNGTMYYDSTNNRVRARVNGVWKTVQVA